MALARASCRVGRALSVSPWCRRSSLSAASLLLTSARGAYQSGARGRVRSREGSTCTCSSNSSRSTSSGSVCDTHHSYGLASPPCLGASSSRSGCRRSLASVASKGVDVSASDSDDRPALPALQNDHPLNNVPDAVAAKVGRNLHHKPFHPIHTIKVRIAEYFSSRSEGSYSSSTPLRGGDGDGGGPSPSFTLFDDLPPIAHVHDNFDSLLIPGDHVSRGPSETYYVDDQHVLRTHTSAHQTSLMQQGNRAFLLCGDVYRRDTVDSSHYPVFHQMEGVRLFGPGDFSPETAAATREERVQAVEKDLKMALEGLARDLFGADTEMRWIDEYFPFTHPSAELEIKFRGEWMEVLGCGVIHEGVMRNAGRCPDTEVGWAFGLGLERLAMVLFQIPDIRLFWTEDERFHKQFRGMAVGAGGGGGGAPVLFKEYSKYPACTKDITFWLADEEGKSTEAETEEERSSAAPLVSSSSPFHENDFAELVRGIAGDLVETVQLLDDFTHPKTGRRSHCFRIVYRSMDRSLTNSEVDDMQERVREGVTRQLRVELR